MHKKITTATMEYVSLSLGTILSFTLLTSTSKTGKVRSRQ